MTRRAVAVVVALVVLPGLGFVLGQRLESRQQAQADAAAPAKSTLTAAVERRVLASEVVARGSVTSETSLTVEAPQVPGAAPVVTATPMRPGDQVNEGDVIVEVAGRPMIALQGPFPLYRDLSVGMSGPDVTMLQQALSRLRLGSGWTAGTFDGPTSAAVEALYRSVGRTAAGGDSGPHVALGELIFRPSLPSVAVTLPAVGDTVGDQGVVPIALASRTLFVDALLPVGQRDAVREGDTSRIVDEVNGKEYPATVSFVAATVTTDASGRPGVEVRVTPDEPLPPGLRNENVRVAISSGATAGEVLVVPFSALVAEPDGSSHVETWDDSNRRRVHVTTGLVANGFAQVTPTGTDRLQPGDQVVVSGP